MVKPTVTVEFRGTPGAGWWWQVRSVPPIGADGLHVYRSGYASTLWGAWRAARKAQRDLPAPPAQMPRYVAP